MEKFNIVIVGHIDHGKSTFVGRLLYDTKSLSEEKLEEIISTCKGLGREFELAYILDAFIEERAGQLTIDTTQVSFRTPMREYVIIDTPGHKEFLKNMVTGASYAQAAILIVSAKDGIQEQTKRHAYILKFFGIKQIIVVINKMDDISYSQSVFESLRLRLDNLLRQFSMQALCVIPISAKHADNVSTQSKNMPWYQGLTVFQSLDMCKNSACQYDFRMPIQDIYNVDNQNIAVGRICSGGIKRGDKVTISPKYLEGKVNSIKVFEAEKDSAAMGENIGIELCDAFVLKRGDVLCGGGMPLIRNNFLAVALCLKGKLLPDAVYTLQCATQEFPCRISKITEKINISTLENIPADSLEEAEIGKIEIVTQEKVVFETFDRLRELGRFVLRSGENIAGIGIIV